MATKRTLVNKKTGVEHKVENADAILKKHKGVFYEKPSAGVSQEVVKKEQQLAKKDIEVKGEEIVTTTSKDRKKTSKK